LVALKIKEIMKIKKLNLQQIIKIVAAIIVIIVVGITGLICFFLYKNFYQTINYSRTILVLRGEIALATPDTATYKEILERVKENGENEIKWEEVKNPFRAYTPEE
jgi:hypothetical protein